MKEQGYSIKDLEVLSGVKAHTIRIWEKRYNLLVPQRTETNIRYYTDEDLKRMLNVSMLVRNGFKISKVSKWDDKKIAENILNLTSENNTEADYIEQLILYMVNFDNINFYRLTNEIINKMGLEESVTKVFFNFFIRIGIYWQVGAVFPAQEHYVSTIFRQKLIAEIDKLGIVHSRPETILFFLPEKEMHEMSLLFYSYLAHKMGYRVIYLGQFVPQEDLNKIQEQVRIDFVFTAFINSITREDLESYLESVKEMFHDQKVFITGWQIQSHNPKLPRNVKIVKDYHDFKKFFR